MSAMKKMTQAEFHDEAKRRFGDNPRDWKFVCPACGTVQSVQELTDALVAAGKPPEDVELYIAFSCIGRFTGQRDEGIAAHGCGEKWDKGCNWTLGGFFQIHTLEVTMPGGKNRPTFELCLKARQCFETLVQI